MNEEKITWKQAVGRMWSRSFDFKGKSAKAEFWPCVAFQSIVFVISVLLLFVMYNFDMPYSIYVCLQVVDLLLIAYCLVSVIPCLSLTARRLRDAEKSVWWSVLVFVLGLGLVIVLVYCNLEVQEQRPLFGEGAESLFQPEKNEPATIYGPPSIFEEE